MKTLINKLPQRFQYTIHNVIGHPLMELLYQLGLHKLSTKVHDSTVPSVPEDVSE